MSECKTCGREDGHWLGCAEAERELRADGWEVGPVVAEGDHCAYGGCTEPKRPKGKGPAPKYCEQHSDPKNRK